MLLIVACSIPLIAGFMLPAGILLEMAITEGDAQFGERFFELSRNSVTVAGLTAVIAVVLAVTLGYASRLRASWLVRGVHRLAGLGYALPGTVIAVGVLIPVSRFDNMLTNWLSQNFGWDSGLVITGGLTGLVYACVVRFLTPAVQSVDAGLQKITPSMDNAASSLGLTPARRPYAACTFRLLRGSLLTAIAGVHRRDEGAARHLGDAALQLRHPGHAGLHIGLRRALAEASTSALAIVVVGLLPLIFLSREIAKARQGQLVERAKKSTHGVPSW
jgi:iron(III) transport system permease protein